MNDISLYIPNISEDRSYWFVRSDHGKYFDTFFENGFIGIGWNYISASRIKLENKEAIEKTILKKEEYDPELQKTKSNLTASFNKLLNFSEFKKGDVVVCPSHLSTELAFGIIADDQIFEEETYNCPYRKRRKINWVIKEKMSNLDPIFYSIKKSRHAISKITDQISHIDNVMETLYIKENNTHFVIDIKLKGELDLMLLYDFLGSLIKVSNEINTYFNFNEDLSKTKITLNLQSPGKVHFKQIYSYTESLIAQAADSISEATRNITSRPETYIVLAMLLSGCDNTIINGKSTDQYKLENKENVDTLNQNADKISVDYEKLRKIKKKK